MEDLDFLVPSVRSGASLGQSRCLELLWVTEDQSLYQLPFSSLVEPSGLTVTQTASCWIASGVKPVGRCILLLSSVTAGPPPLCSDAVLSAKSKVKSYLITARLYCARHCPGSALEPRDLWAGLWLEPCPWGTAPGSRLTPDL